MYFHFRQYGFNRKFCPEIFITNTQVNNMIFHVQKYCIQIQLIDKKELLINIKHSIFQEGVISGLDYNITPPSTTICGLMAD